MKFNCIITLFHEETDSFFEMLFLTSTKTKISRVLTGVMSVGSSFFTSGFIPIKAQLVITAITLINSKANYKIHIIIMHRPYNYSDRPTDLFIASTCTFVDNVKMYRTALVM